MKTKIALILSALIIIACASIGSVGAYKPQPHAMVWIVPTDTPNVYTLTYQNFGYKSIGGISVSIVNQEAFATEDSNPALATFTATYSGWTVQYSSTQISWQSNHAPDRTNLDFYAYNTPCTVQYTLFDKNGNVLQTNPMSLP